MANQTRQILIQSILGGHSLTTNFSAEDEFRTSLGIDPSLPINDDETSVYGVTASGLLRPAPVMNFSGTVGNQPRWIVGARSTTTLFMYDISGSAYTLDTFGGNVAGISDGGSLSDSLGNGLAYYDNYLYFAKNTTIARYGPLDGTPGFDGDYWGTTLSKTALSNIEYPLLLTIPSTYTGVPNHYLHRHSDGKLYIADTIDNKGTIHFISTTKTTVEGDTDNGSTYNKLQFGYGLIPICMESYGSNLAVALYERAGNANVNNVTGRSHSVRAKIAFWDTTSQNFNQITWVEFPDAMITAMKNVNGVLYVFSTSVEGGTGYRISRFVGGYTYEEVISSESGTSPFPGAVDGTSKRLVFGTQTMIPEQNGCVFSYGLQKSQLTNGLFNIAGTPTANVSVTALILPGGEGTDARQGFDLPVFAWTNSSSSHGVSLMATQNTPRYGRYPSVWWSKVFSIGQKFKIKRIRIPLGQVISSTMTVVPKIYTDDGAGTTYTLTTIDNNNYSGKRSIVIRPENCTGENNFWLELRWTGSALCTVSLPIIIDYELIDD